MPPSILVTLNPNPIADDDYYFLEATKCLSRGLKFVSDSEYRFITAISGEAEFPREVGAQYIKIFGPLVPGTRIFFRASTIRAFAGQRSKRVETSVLVS